MRCTRPIKKLPVILVILICPATVFSDTGKTDGCGGHKYLKRCEEGNLYYKEYHLHDKDGKPIRIARKTKQH